MHSIYHRFTWTTSDDCYLQDLFADDARGNGVGRALIAPVASSTENYFLDTLA